MYNKCLLLIATVNFLFIGCSTQINSSNPNITLFKNLCTQKGQVSWDIKKDKLICIIGSNTVYYENQGIEGLNAYPDIYNKYGYDKVGFNRAGYNQDGYDLNGFDTKGINKDTLTKYDKQGYDKNGFNHNGYDKFGFNQNGKNKNGFLLKDYFKELCVDSGGTVGWNLKADIPTCNIDNKIIDGNNKGFKILITYSSGYDSNGCDKNGYDLYGFNIKGLNKNTLTKYDKDGYDRDGFSKDGFNRSSQDKNGYYRDGFNAKGINKDTLTQYDKNGKNKDGLTRQEQTQKEYNDALLTIEKEKLLIEKQRLEHLKAQATSTQNAAQQQSSQIDEVLQTLKRDKSDREWNALMKGNINSYINGGW